ncbi:hypothetical protein P3T76_001323 [Phytophthora citrophthora]|uniref:Uncharacterized protein n=1 Tax=Phytophthora citrophthora TaxID=4793 RepID=A0AAD9H059_9STRA|nr:hypothetical protein P3T76_001323 [Phytophthora citrophthora]
MNQIAEDERDSKPLQESGVQDETESMRHEAELRLRIQSNELKRFHDKICMRVTVRERQNRLAAQRAQNHLDEKCAKVFLTTQTALQSETTVAKRVSACEYFQKLKEDKAAILKNCSLGKHIENVILHADAQIRDDLLRSTEISRSYSVSDYERGNNESGPAKSPVLLPEQVRLYSLRANANFDLPIIIFLQRVALYATVRRQYMEMNRAKVQNNVWRHPPNSNKAKSPLSNSSIVAAVSGSRSRRAGNADHNIGEQWTAVKIIDMTAGCDVRVHRQVTTSSTPWRKKSTKKRPPRQNATTEHERFLRALQAQIGGPSLCSCGKVGSNSTCANNCALYKQPKKREKLFTSVYKQQQQEGAVNAASPIH